MNFRRIAATLSTILLILFGAWVAGYDFDHRGAHAFWVYLVCLFYSGMVLFAPFWRNEE